MHRLELEVKNALPLILLTICCSGCIIYMRKHQKNAENYMKLCPISKNALALMRMESRWVSHKLNAMRRILSKYGAYTSHLAALSEDRSI